MSNQLGVKFFLNHKVSVVKNNGKNVTVTALSSNDEEIKIDADYCLISIGRKPYTENLSLAKAGVEVDSSGRIRVDNMLQTTQSGIFAIGDVVEGAMLAHKAEEEGVFVAEILAGQKPHINHNLIPNVVYTWPEVASVGLSEEKLKAEKIKYKVGVFPFKANGRAKISMDTDGFVKILADSQSDEILGVHMIGPRCADLISEAVVAMEYLSLIHI